MTNTTTIAAPTIMRQVKNQNDANVPIGYKRCSHCGKILPLSEFYKDKNGKYGVKYCCKKCWNKAQWQYQKKTAKKSEPEIPAGYKKCSCCGEVKPLSEFWVNKNLKGGHETQCKDCLNKKRKEKRAEKREEQEKQTATQPKLPFDYDRRIKRAHALSFAPDTKECNQCHQVKPMTEFQTCSKNPDHLANTCKQCMSDNRKKTNQLKKQQKEEEAMKQQQAKTKNNVQTFEYLAIGTRLCFIHGDTAMESPIQNVEIDITANGALISYIVPTNKPEESRRIYANEIGSTVFTNPLDLISYFFKKQDMKYNVIKK